MIPVTSQKFSESLSNGVDKRKKKTLAVIFLYQLEFLVAND